MDQTFRILLLCSHFLSVNVCDVKYTKQPLYRNRCVPSSNTEVSLRQTDRPQCMWKCLKLKTCRYINHNAGTGQCDLGLDKCESLEPAVGVTVNVFGPPRDVCVQWGPRHQHGRVPVEVQFLGKVIYLARILTGNSLLVGKFTLLGNFWANDEGVKVGPVLERDQDIEFLTKDSACTLLWMPYMAGEKLPVGAVSGGLLSDGSTTYVSKVTHGAGRMAFGYYNTEAALVYYELGGAHTKTTMEVLVLLWAFLFLADRHIYCTFHWRRAQLVTCVFARPGRISRNWLYNACYIKSYSTKHQRRGINKSGTIWEDDVH